MSWLRDLLGQPPADEDENRVICGWCNDGFCEDFPSGCSFMICDCTHEIED